MSEKVHLMVFSDGHTYTCAAYLSQLLAYKAGAVQALSTGDDLENLPAMVKAWRLGRYRDVVLLFNQDNDAQVKVLELEVRVQVTEEPSLFASSPER
jgi:hypothetical protein